MIIEKKGYKKSMKLLIDTNIIIDILLARNNYENSIKLFQYINDNSFIDGFISASSITDIFYIIRKETHSYEKTYNAIEGILKILKIMPVSKNDIIDAIKFHWKDFEDCVQYTISKNNKIDFIITNNVKDFLHSEISILTPQEFIKLFID